MLTRKELDYVTSTKPPYPGDKYSLEALKMLKDALDLYKDYYKDKEYDIIFSDSSSLTFSIEESNLAHMLGLEYKKLRKNSYFNNIETDKSLSYEMMEKITNNPQEILEVNKDENYSLLNLYRIIVRSKVFNKFSNFKDLNFGCINYDSNIASNNGIKTYMKSDRFLFIDSDEFNAPYYMMGIANKDNTTYVETLFADLYPEKMFKDQRITIPTSISVTTSKDYNTMEATSSQKLRLLKCFMSDLNKYNCNFDIYNDYLNVLSNDANRESKKRYR